MRSDADLADTTEVLDGDTHVPVESVSRPRTAHLPIRNIRNRRYNNYTNINNSQADGWAIDTHRQPGTRHTQTYAAVAASWREMAVVLVAANTAWVLIKAAWVAPREAARLDCRLLDGRPVRQFV